MIQFKLQDSQNSKMKFKMSHKFNFLNLKLNCPKDEFRMTKT